MDPTGVRRAMRYWRPACHPQAALDRSDGCSVIRGGRQPRGDLRAIARVRPRSGPVEGTGGGGLTTGPEHLTVSERFYSQRSIFPVLAGGLASSPKRTFDFPKFWDAILSCVRLRLRRPSGRVLRNPFDGGPQGSWHVRASALRWGNQCLRMSSSLMSLVRPNRGAAHRRRGVLRAASSVARASAGSSWGSCS